MLSIPENSLYPLFFLPTRPLGHSTLGKARARMVIMNMWIVYPSEASHQLFEIFLSVSRFLCLCLSLPVSLSLTLSFCLLFSLSLALYLSLALSPCVILCLILCLSFSIILSLFRCHSLSVSVSLSPSASGIEVPFVILLI